MLKPWQFLQSSTYLLAKESEDREIEVNKIFTEGPMAKDSLLELNYKGHREIIVGQRTSKTDCIAYWIQKNKQLAKFFFKKAGINVSEGQIFNYSDSREILSFCHKIKFPVVIKPLSGIQGKHVFVDLNSDQKVRAALAEFKNTKFKKIIVEKMFFGKEYRLLATKDKFVAATLRVPANVVGDGFHTIKDLIKEKNMDTRRGMSHEKSLVKIKVDEAVRMNLKKQKKNLDCIPKKGEQIFLRANSNISTGGDSYDSTEDIHPEVKKLAVKVIRAIPGLGFGGIDYLTTDVTKKPNKKNYIIIEVNDSPMLSIHHEPYSGKPRNAAGAIIDQLYPETVKKLKRKKPSKKSRGSAKR
ncbi:MAG TPA: hypothetical protein VMX18_03620 [Candidatus Bipolaricaulota bacterium]|nr:hypothetical protein [Candidatus Bipolaricaulota bacterium]